MLDMVPSSYGAEMRGGTVNCEIVTSDEDVSEVNKPDADSIVALNQASFDRFLPKIKKGGWMIANSTLVKEDKPRADMDYSDLFQLQNLLMRKLAMLEWLIYLH